MSYTLTLQLTDPTDSELTTLAGALLNLTSHGEDDDAFSATETFDTTSWRDAIAGASSKDELDTLGAELKKVQMPAGALKTVRAAWAARAKELAA